jgi:16S rRNA (cytidine1402-2'-O)-methyltransferase
MGSGPWRPPPGGSRGLPLDPGLYVVATPIGNLADITLRALDVLAGVEAILAEDTRQTGKLLAAYGIAKPLKAVHDHNEDAAAGVVIARIQAGAALALVSDAGTPLVSDPGFRLVRAAIAAGVRVIPLPGPSAALAGLVVAGLPSDRFLFAGFAPAKSAARQTFYGELAAVAATLIVYETGPRLAESLADAALVLGPRPAAVARELTKLYEETRRDDLAELAAHYAAAAPPKGEIVLLIAGPPPPTAIDEQMLNIALQAALDRLSLKDAAAEVADAFGLKRRDVYQRALALKAPP